MHRQKGANKEAHQKKAQAKSKMADLLCILRLDVLRLLSRSQENLQVYQI